MYDKYRESEQEEYVRCWRYEVECKGDAAKKAATFLAAVGYSSEAIASGVSNWYRTRGITPRYRPTVAGALGPIGSAPTDAERQLTWLSRQVAPVAKRLVQVYGKETVLEVLFGGMDPLEAQPSRMEGDEALALYDEWTILSE